jgi:hypothetical protein
MALIINKPEKEKIFKQVRTLLGSPIRKLEIKDEYLETLLEIAVEDHSSNINNWLIEHQWNSLLGENLATTDLTRALTTRTLDYETKFTYAYSKLVGLQAGGEWELKQDYVTLETGKQIYEIPSGREINEILWFTPPTIDHALWSFYAIGDYGFGGGFAQNPFAGGGGGMGMGGFFLAPAYDILLRDIDLGLKQRLISSELTYKITAGPNGTKLLHLFPPPGSRISFGGGFGRSGGIDISGSKVWYYYYETNSEEERRKCLNANKDIIKLPSDVPVDIVNFDELNSPSKQWVREWFKALVKEYIAKVRGKFGGKVGAGSSEVTMDYQMFANEAKEEKTELLRTLNERLERMSPQKMLERRASEAENLNKTLQYRPLGIYII